jgi:hypothetical protein
MGRSDDLLIGLQTHPLGRFARPNHKTKLEPQILYAHPFLNAKFNLAADHPVMSDTEIEVLIGDFVTAGSTGPKVGLRLCGY